MPEFVENRARRNVKNYKKALLKGGFKCYSAVREIGVYGGTWVLDIYSSFLRRLIFSPLVRVTSAGDVYYWDEDNELLAKEVERIIGNT